MPTAVLAYPSSPEVGALTAFADPMMLPARLTVTTRIGHRVVVDLDRDHTVIRRIDSDGAPTVVTPMRLYKGVAVQVERPGLGAPVFHLELMHGEAERGIPLAVGGSIEAVSEAWHAWGRALALPLIVVDVDGKVHAALRPLGGFLAETPSPRRHGSPLVGRRSRFARRRTSGSSGTSVVVRGEREIIAPY